MAVANVYTVQFGVSKEFAVAVKAAVSVTAKRSKHPILESVVISFKRSEVTLSATNLDTYYSNTVIVPEIDVTQEFSVVVHRDVLKGLKAKTAVTVNETFITVNGVTYKPAGTSEDFPQFPQLADTAHMVQVSKQYFSDLAACAVSASGSEVRPILTAIQHSTDKLVATDGLRLLRARPGTEFPAAFNLPASNADILQKSFPDGATLRYDDKFASYSRNGVLIICRLLDGSYPDTDRIIPTQCKTSVAVQDVQPWIAAMKSVIAVYNTAAKKDRDYIVQLNISANDKQYKTTGTVEVSATCKSTGAMFSDVLPVSMAGSDLSIAVNATYLLDALQQIGGNCEIRFDGNNRPFVITAADRTALVAPVFLRK